MTEEVWINNNKLDVNPTDIQIITDAFKRYVRRKDKNISLLCEYGKKLKVEEKLQSYLEVLL